MRTESIVRGRALVTPRSAKRKAVPMKVLAYTLLILLSVVMILPFVWMLSSSFKPLSEVFHYPPALIPKTPSLNAYVGLFQQYPFARNLLNSFYIAASYAILAVFFCSLGGYAFAKYDFPGKGLLFAIVLGSMLIPFEVTMVPLYVLFRDIGWIDKHWGLIIPGVANAFGIFFMRQYVVSIPTELIEAGRIDGCSEFGIFRRIIMPVVLPAAASLGIIFFMNSWNAFLWPLVVLKSPDMFTAPLAIRGLQGPVYAPYHMIMAGSVLTTLPLIVIFLLLQRQIIAGLTSGAVKG